MKVFCPAKTVVDCFKYRNKIGLDVALEALLEGWSARKFTMDELLHYAEICRVKKVMQPYLTTPNISSYHINPAMPQFMGDDLQCRHILIPPCNTATAEQIKTTLLEYKGICSTR